MTSLRRTPRPLALLAVVLVLVLAVGGIAPADARGHHHRHHGHHKKHLPKSHVGLSKGGEILFGRQFKLTGKVRPFRHIPRRHLSLQVRHGRHWTWVKNGIAGKKGGFEFNVPTYHAGPIRYRVVAKKSKRAAYATSDARTVLVNKYRTKATAAWPADTVALGSPPAITGTVGPNEKGRTIYLQRAVPGGWALMRKTTTKTGTYSLPLPAQYLATYRLRLVIASTNKFKGIVLHRNGTVQVVNTWNATGDPADHYFLHKRQTRWNPCTPIDYRINTTYAPSYALQDLKTAFHNVTVATGIHFRYRGHTHTIPQLSTRHYDKGIDLVVFWANYHQTDHLKASDETTVIARGGAAYYRTGFVDGAGRKVQKSAIGSIVFNTAFNDQIAEGSGAGQTLVGVLMHETGHVLGLDHALGADEIMYKNTDDKVDQWGLGDIAGLQDVGFGKGCIFRDRSHRSARQDVTPRAATPKPALVSTRSPYDALYAVKP